MDKSWLDPVDPETPPPPNPFALPVGSGLPPVPIVARSALETDPPPVELLAALGRLARDTRRALRLALLARGGQPPAAVRSYLQGTLNHLGQVREGFVLSLRVEEVVDSTELRDLIEEILVDWSWMRRLGIRWIPLDQPLERPLAQVLAFAQARSALGALPHLPAERVTFPSPVRSYADIPVPKTPGEILERLDEIEQVIARTLNAHPGSRGPAGSLVPPRPVETWQWRRAYGFFETSAWLLEPLQR